MIKRLIITCAILAVSISKPTTGQAQSQEAFPLEYWAVRAQMSNVQVSPDGKKLAFEKISSREGNPVIEIRDVDDLGGTPLIVGGKNMEITNFYWVGNDGVIISFRDQVSRKIDGFNRGAYRGKTAYYNTTTKKFDDLSDATSRDFKNVQFINALPGDPDRVLVRIFEVNSGPGGMSRGGLRSDVYKLNLKTNKRELVMNGDSKYFGVRFDHEGNPRFAASRSGKEFVYHYKLPNQSNWKEFHRVSEREFENFSYVELDHNDPNKIYVMANNGHDLIGLWKFNLLSGTFGELVHRDPVVDIYAGVRHSNEWSNPGQLAGVRTFKDKFHTKYFDSQEQNMISKFETSIANSGFVDIWSRSRDGKTIVVRNRSAKDPGSYYLYTADDGKFRKLGSVNGLLKPEGLSDVEYITYPSRDGKQIPAFVTKPKGAGPHKLVVMPHGGPFVRETIVFDEWAQMLANNGYMVLQPQYRGSKGYGLDFYKTAFINGGEGGKKMQDDKDDGVRYLIEKGLVDKDKVAFFGWSYGGYAALVAASRSPNLYQCAIAGASVADNDQQLNYYREFLDSDRASDIEQIKFWTESINPGKEVENVNIPVLLIHGSIDQRVPIRHAKKYVKKLKSNKKNYEYLELKNADHFSNTLFYKHKMEMYPAMIDYLKNECGM